MRYTPHTALDQEQMLGALGLSRIEELYEHIPRPLQERGGMALPPGLSEVGVKKKMASLAAKNATAEDWHFFLGGGIYQHAIPSAVDAVITRSEFSTSYTPYQPEVSQGTLQAIYEFQTLICQLTAMEVANAGLYDGASAAAEAVLMARRVQESRRRVFISRALHPHYRAVIATYLRNLEGVELVEIPFGQSGGIDVEVLTHALDETAMCVVVGYPNFFGIVEDLRPIREVCTRSGVLLITVTTEPLALALLRPPGAWGADIGVGEGQSLGVPMSLGGPGFGFFSCAKKFVRSMPGRLVGETVDSEGRRGFVLTLSTREQHIRREKATSNICTNQNLCTLAATAFMATLGKSGMRRLAEINLRHAHEASDRLIGETGLAAAFSGPFFNEFVLKVRGLTGWLQRLAAKRIVPGIPLGRWYPELEDALLVCVTEMNDKEEIDTLVRTVSGE
ncbi:MAG: glycine dehydrogenase (aminomethyl-transferring) [Deltaproteobacteria bacterium RIFCSPLOWO2_02_FULL_57_26]|nr:MAG: glycine dehydrogenase (aminomethyl-transferring) [Deltaproteobacteria bacterium RIFCSPLOWO2_02_FULL_57_26]OGQ83943.1 MAG: glycine dehydrogenase (aminomethyl-transferring) [Deltaproteobacteria bacterium RIFCSPLOWO2_12_FULL_57_22]